MNYKDSDGVETIDSFTAFQTQMDNLPFRGELSDWKPLERRFLVFVGKDEAIFKQFLFHSRMWTGPQGERAYFQILKVPVLS